MRLQKIIRLSLSCKGKSSRQHQNWRFTDLCKARVIVDIYSGVGIFKQLSTNGPIFLYRRIRRSRRDGSGCHCSFLKFIPLHCFLQYGITTTLELYNYVVLSSHKTWPHVVVISFQSSPFRRPAAYSFDWTEEIFHFDWHVCYTHIGCERVVDNVMLNLCDNWSHLCDNWLQKKIQSNTPRICVLR